MRDESSEDVDARSEPVLALTLLAGIATALASSTARTLYDDPEYDGLLVAIWAVIAGGVIAFAGYFIVGGALYLGTRGLGSVGTFRRARHILAFAVAPIALSLVARLAAPARVLTAATSSVAAAPTTGRGAFLRPARAGLRRLGGRAASRRRPGRARLDLVALPRRARARRPFPSGVREPPLDLLGLPRRRSSSSAGMAYVCCSSGKRRSRTSST